MVGVDAYGAELDNDEWHVISGDSAITYFKLTGSNIDCTTLHDICTAKARCALLLAGTDISADCVLDCLKCGSIETVVVEADIGEGILNADELYSLKSIYIIGAPGPLAVDDPRVSVHYVYSEPL